MLTFGSTFLTLHGMYKFLKRAEDITVSLVVLAVLSPLMAAVCMALYFSVGSPIFYNRMRAGKGGAPFKLYKFRSMTDEKGPDGLELPDDKRITPIGKFIRKTSIDELPQLFNVLKGDMSLVGPRPLLLEYNDMYSPKHKRRLDVLPGITGYAAVNGRNEVSFSKKFDMDVHYVENASFLLDNLILFKTFFAVLARRGSTETTAVGEVDDLGFVKRVEEIRRKKLTGEQKR